MVAVKLSYSKNINLSLICNRPEGIGAMLAE